MLYRLCFLVLAAMTPLTFGCGTSSEPVSAAQPPSNVVKDPVGPIKEAETSARVDAASIETFLRQDSVCRQVLERRSLADFLTEHKTAEKDNEQSRAGIKYVVYRDSMFMYEFLDEKLFAIRFVVPRSSKSAADWVAPYLKAFGPPTNTKVPDEFREAKPSRFLSWDLPHHNLRVNFAYLPASFVEADLDLFGQFINRESAQEYLKRSTSFGTSQEAPVPMPCHALQLAFGLASKQDERDPSVMELWTGIGKRCAQFEDLEATGHVLKLLEEKEENALTRSCRAKIAAEMVAVLTAAGQPEKALTFVDRIPSTASQQRCAAFSAIAIARESKNRQGERDPFWRKAIDAIDQVANVQERSENRLVIIRNLARANRLAEAEVLAENMQTALSNRRGWAPIAETLAISGDVDAANEILQEKLIGLDEDYYQFIRNVLAERKFQSRFEICRAALRRIQDPIFLAHGSCVLFGEMTGPNQRAEARREMGRALEKAGKARFSKRDTAAVLVSAIDPMVELEGKSGGLNMCESLKGMFAPEFAAEGYRKLATHSAADPKEVSRYLEIAEELARDVRVPAERFLALRQIYRTRGAFLGEDDALRLVENLAAPLDRGYAWLGTAEGVSKQKMP